MTGLILDGAILLLLATTTLYCIKVSRQIRVLRQEKKAFEQMIQAFDQSIMQASHNVEELKVLSDEADGLLIEHINKARHISNNLSFLMDKGEVLSDKLQASIVRPTVEPKEPTQNNSLSAKRLRSADSPPSLSKQKALQNALEEIARRKQAVEQGAQEARNKKQSPSEPAPQRGLEAIAKRRIRQRSETEEETIPQRPSRRARSAPADFTTKPTPPSEYNAPKTMVARTIIET